MSNNILECQIYSDSTYVVKGINEWMNKWMDKKWRGSSGHQIKNIELWKDVASLWNRAREVSNISIHHVKGHSDNQWNNYADK
ncbi:RNase H family protein, partial [Loigolactobacillus coryniformis]|uniref:RNase H family protein n=1 Tax=Loigolactobacillus coryniformis TaxID=1610 RepID=UPI00387E458B